MTSTSKTKTPRSRLDQLIAGRFQIVRYADLPRPHQLGMAHYMAVDGEAWDDLLALPRGRRHSKAAIVEALKAALPQYVREYGDDLFGMARLPASAVLESVIHDKEIDRDWKGDWKAYHAWYRSTGGAPNHPRRNRWPVILSSTNDETLQDGWHRLHTYVCQGARSIPALFYAQPRHLNTAALA